MFNQPSEPAITGGYFKPAEHDNNLILFETVIEAGTEFDQMTNSDREFRIVSFVNLDTTGAPQKGKVTHTGLVRKLPVGATNILGRIEKVKTANGYMAWVLQPFQPADEAKAKAWLDAGRPSTADPFEQDAATAADIGVTPEMLAQLKRLGMINE